MIKLPAAFAITSPLTPAFTQAAEDERHRGETPDGQEAAPDNADEISARANDGDAGQGPPTKREIEQGRLNNE